MSIVDYLLKQAPDRKKILSALHKKILKTDDQAIAEVEKMMSVEMIVYKTSGVFKYGLASTKSHMSLHLLPIYVSPALHAKYKKLLSQAKFQKGCINFKTADEMPLNIAEKLLKDCAKVDIVSMIEERKKSR